MQSVDMGRDNFGADIINLLESHPVDLVLYLLLQLLKLDELFLHREAFLHVFIGALEFVRLGVIVFLEIYVANIDIIFFKLIQFFHKVFVLSLNCV